MNCIRKFFRKRFRYDGASWPTWKDVIDGELQVDADVHEDVQAGSSTAAQRNRIDLEVEASGFNRDLQLDLENVSTPSHCGWKTQEQYMLDVHDLPDSEDGNASDGDEASDLPIDDEVDDALPEHGEPPDPPDNDPAQNPISHRLEAIRLQRALGNDDGDEFGTHSTTPRAEEGEYSDSESDFSDSDDPAPTDYTTYSRPVDSKSPHHSKATSNGRGHLGRADRPSASKGVKAGSAKGHKWKKSPSYLIGKQGGDW